MFRKILIANRGEIACRVIRDRSPPGHPHRRGAFRGRCRAPGMSPWPTRRCRSGAPAVSDSYLRGDRILDAAPAHGRRGDPSRLWLPVGERRISPRPARPRAWSSSARRPPRSAPWACKDAAKALMERAGVPVVPGYHGETQDRGAPGGGGRAHRLSRADQGERRRRREGHAPGRRARRVRRRARGARREAQAAFGDDRRAARAVPARSRATWRCRSSPTATATSCTCSSATAPCSAATRRCSRKRRRRACRRRCAPPWAAPPSRPRAPSAIAAPARSSSSSMAAAACAPTVSGSWR